MNRHLIIIIILCCLLPLVSACSLFDQLGLSQDVTIETGTVQETQNTDTAKTTNTQSHQTTESTANETSGSSSDSQEAILTDMNLTGTWQDQSGATDTVYTIQGDGSYNYQVSLADSSGVLYVSGVVQQTENSLLFIPVSAEQQVNEVIESVVPISPPAFTYKIENGQLILSMDDQTILTLTKTE